MTTKRDIETAGRDGTLPVAARLRSPPSFRQPSAVND